MTKAKRRDSSGDKLYLIEWSDDFKLFHRIECDEITPAMEIKLRKHSFLSIAFRRAITCSVIDAMLNEQDAKPESA
jgi:hypothetical protein